MIPQVIKAPDTDISGRFKPLTSSIIDPSTILQKPCAQRFYTDTIHFVSQKYEILPDSPYGLRTVLADSNLKESHLLFSKPGGILELNYDGAEDILCRQTTQ